MVCKIHQFFKERAFTLIQTPCITSNDAEGAGESFHVATLNKDEKYTENFFGKKATLAVSGQLHAESYAQALKAVYTFGPTFRADKSNTSKHIAEFWMLEPEFIYADLDKNMDLIEALMKAIASHLKTNCSTEITFLAKITETNLEPIYDSIINNKFARITYTKAIEKLQAAIENGHKFDVNDIHFGIDLQTEHERYLAENITNGPLFLYDFPKDIKSFYMKLNPDNKTVAGCDLLVPGVGEIVGGSQREDDYHKLIQRCQELNLNTKSLQ